MTRTWQPRRVEKIRTIRRAFGIELHFHIRLCGKMSTFIANRTSDHFAPAFIWPFSGSISGVEAVRDIFLCVSFETASGGRFRPRSFGWKRLLVLQFISFIVAPSAKKGKYIPKWLRNRWPRKIDKLIGLYLRINDTVECVQSIQNTLDSVSDKYTE